MLTIVSFVAVLGVIIFVHEFGHLITAKAFGMRVFIFSFGFGKRLAGFKWGDTDCRLSLIPLGGYVKLEGEPDDHLSDNVQAQGDAPAIAEVLPGPHDFTSRPRWQRFLVYVAGPFMNGVLTIAVFTTLYMIGWQTTSVLYDRPVVGAVDLDSPAASAGLRAGDEILSIDSVAQRDWEDALTNVLARPERDAALRIKRGAEEIAMTVRIQSRDKAGYLGVAPLVRIGEVRSGNAADRAGLRVDDGILRIDGKAVQSFEDIVSSVRAAAPGQALAFEVYRDSAQLTIPVTPEKGLIGVTSKGGFRQLPFAAALPEAFRASARVTRQTLGMLQQLLTARISPRAGVMGPIGIASATGEAARSGIRSVLYLVAVLSLSVGLLNLFPIAPLDGGHLAILAGEGLVRRDFSPRVKGWIMNAGAVVIFALIGVVLYSDLSKTSLLGKYLP